ncbi:MAG: GNAT family N-acetyltransferase [Clostridium sp.]
MKFFYADALEHRRHLKLSALFDLCFPSPGLPGALPADADGLWLAADENDELTGCLLLFQTDLHSWEGIPFVHPVYRRKGIFSALLANACQKGNCPGEDDLFFSVRPTQTLWLQVLNSIEAEKAFDEYMMEYSFQNLPSARLKTEADFSDELTVSFQGTEGMASCPHVSCLLSAHGSSVYLYQLLTEEAFRGQGRALAFLHHLFPRLKALGFSSVRLQVSGENLPAMALYKKTGFHITETLSFYLY